MRKSDATCVGIRKNSEEVREFTAFHTNDRRAFVIKHPTQASCNKSYPAKLTIQE